VPSDRRGDTFGRETVIVRLFCFRHADLAECGVSYAEIVEAVRDQLSRPARPSPRSPFS
jgi:hypothetical protein